MYPLNFFENKQHIHFQIWNESDQIQQIVVPAFFQFRYLWNNESERVYKHKTQGKSFNEKEQGVKSIY